MEPKPLNAKAHHAFRATVGRLMWLAGRRPDGLLAIKELARACDHPTEPDIANLKRALRYFHGSLSAALHLQWDDKIDDGICITIDAS